jgi:hypothetical protein
LISFDYVNTIRMNLILDKFFDTNSTVAVASPQHVAQEESLWFILPSLQRFTRYISNQAPPCPPIDLGVSFNDYCRVVSNDTMVTWEEGLRDGRSNKRITPKDGYLLSAVSTGDEYYKIRIMVCFLSNVTPLQESKAYFHAKLLCRILAEHYRRGVYWNDLQKLEAQTEGVLETTWRDFVTFCTDAGWDLNRSELETRGYEVQIMAT